MEANKSHNDPKKPKYTLGEHNLDIMADMQFIRQLMEDLRVNVDPVGRGIFLDIAYTLARDKLVDAARYAKLSNRSNVTVEDLKMVHLDETDELKIGVQTLKNPDVAQEILPKPCMEKGLMLPNWRNCQVGMVPELQTAQNKPQPTKVVPTRPPIVRRPAKGQNLVAMAALGKSSVPQIRVISAPSKGPGTSRSAPMQTVSVKIAPMKAASVKPNSEAFQPSDPPVAKKMRPN